MRRVLLLVGVLGLAFFAGCQSDAGPVVVIETSMGNIKVELNERDAPVTVKNFLQYVDDKHYDGTIFHRVVKGLVIQGGGFTDELKEKPPRLPIKNEAYNGLSNKRGTVAMARTGEPNSATSQFYINCRDNSQAWDRKSGNKGEEGYCVFGKVIDGMTVVDAINSVKTVDAQQFEGLPLQPVVIKSVRRVEAK